MKLKYLTIAIYVLYGTIFAFSSNQLSPRDKDDSIISLPNFLKIIQQGLRQENKKEETTCCQDSHIWCVCIVKELKDKACCCLPDCCFPCLPPKPQQME